MRSKTAGSTSPQVGSANVLDDDDDDEDEAAAAEVADVVALVTAGSYGHVVDRTREVVPERRQ